LECTRLDKFRAKYAKEIESIDSLVIQNHLGKFAQQGGKVILSASVSSASLSTLLDLDDSTTAKRRFDLWKDIISTDMDKGDEQKQEKEALGAWAPPSKSDESRELAEGIARECRFMPKRYSSDDSNSTRGDQEAEANAPTYAQMMESNFSLSVDQDDFSAIQAAIFELIRGVVGGDVEDVDVDEVVLQRFIRRIGTMYRYCLRGILLSPTLFLSLSSPSPSHSPSFSISSLSPSLSPPQRGPLSQLLACFLCLPRVRLHHQGDGHRPHRSPLRGREKRLHPQGALHHHAVGAGSRCGSPRNE
jgi:hypothetical protein